MSGVSVITPSNIVERDETVQDTHQLLKSLDLSMLRMKLTDPVEGVGWDEEETRTHENEYLAFLALWNAYSDLELAPSKDIDHFWHAHILDTRKYAADCDAVFGRFVHHFPYFGMRGNDDQVALARAYARTVELMNRHFQLDLPLDSGGNCSRGTCWGD